MTAAILTGKYGSILRTTASENGFVGIPKTLLQLNPSHQVAVIEVGIDQVGAMSEHCDLVRPTVSVVTSVAPEHMEFLRDLDTVAKEECLLFQKTSEFGGTSLINIADPFIRPYAQIKGSHTFAPVDSGCHAEISGELQNTAGTTRDPKGDSNSELGQQVRILMSDTPPFSLPWTIHGKHNLSNLLAAVAVAKQLGMTPQEMTLGWANYRPLQNRSHVERLAGGVRVIRDEYNASPASVEAALEMLSDLAQEKGRKWFCFADMLELGDQEETYHRALAPFVKKAGVDGVFTLGKRAAFLADSLRKDHVSEMTIQECLSHREMVQALLSVLGKNDTVLLKGSRSMKMEQVWQGLQSSFPGPPEISL
jgi:UDP-N-acetylmuramyl pentapeptide synthase